MPDKYELWLPPSHRPGKPHRSVRPTFKAVYLWTGLPGKTLWDTLQLLGVLAIPVVVVVASSLFSAQLNQTNLKASEQQHQTDIQLAADQQREVVLQNYLDSISGLLLNNNLLRSGPEDPVRKVAAVQTLTALTRLDPARKVILLRFLSEANLIGGFVGSGCSYASTFNIEGIVSLEGADLSDIDLSDSGIDLSGTNLSGTDLSGADLRNADLRNADLVDADLHNADLTDANLCSASLNGANLSDANLKSAFLLYAFLNNTNLTQHQLNDVYSCQGISLDQGLTCLENKPFPG